MKGHIFKRLQPCPRACFPNTAITCSFVTCLLIGTCCMCAHHFNNYLGLLGPMAVAPLFTLCLPGWKQTMETQVACPKLHTGRFLVFPRQCVFIDVIHCSGPGRSAPVLGCTGLTECFHWYSELRVLEEFSCLRNLLDKAAYHLLCKHCTG